MPPFCILKNILMFSSKEAIFDIQDVPEEWIFEYYLGLTTKLNGQSIKMKSLFNVHDKTPSMYVYLNPTVKKYKFKCFSTGLQGNAINLIMMLKSLDFKSAVTLVIADYKNYIKDKTFVKTEIKECPKWKLYDVEYRSWNKDDKEYWSKYNISSSLLQLYNVKPISSFAMYKENESFKKIYKRIYAYTQNNTSLEGIYKIYMPENENKKFMTLSNYVQGWEQLEGHSRLFICSSLKDIMAMKSLNITGDYIAPSSENAKLDSIINWIQEEYEQQYVIFDNDEPGIKMMNKYKEQYNLSYIHLDLSKDISDSIKDHGAKKVKQYLTKFL